ncbi:hypothetical protein Ciccas_007368 [Cichlidogyrus casuarinus]|uniref:Uncharacterized protein n=1 Tax=Cichlidogyrus casuarinus TaxID=1844966 RepID=A0ABD2Q717_9PLAT
MLGLVRRVVTALTFFYLSSRLARHRFKVESSIAQHQAKLRKLEQGEAVESMEEEDEEPRTLEEMVEHEKESIEALNATLTPQEMAELSATVNKMQKLFTCEWGALKVWFVANLYLTLFPVEKSSKKK